MNDWFFSPEANNTCLNKKKIEKLASESILEKKKKQNLQAIGIFCTMLFFFIYTQYHWFSPSFVSLLLCSEPFIMSDSEILVKTYV